MTSLIGVATGLLTSLTVAQNCHGETENGTKDWKNSSESYSVAIRTSEMLKEELSNSLETIQQTLRLKYAPAEWKALNHGWDLKTEIATAKARMHAHHTLEFADCRQILIDFFLGICDYHVSCQFHATAFSYLPFRVKSSEGRYFISWVDKEMLWERMPHLDIGDELIAFDGQRCEEVIEYLRNRYFNHGAPLTDTALAELALTLRMGRLGMDTPVGEVALKVRRGTTYIDAAIEWISAAEQIPNPLFHRVPLYKSIADPHTHRLKKGQLGKHPFFHRKMQTPLQGDFKAIFESMCDRAVRPDEVIDNGFFILGNKRSYVPTLGKVVWKSAKHNIFHAYIYEHPFDKKTIGYVRIPDYNPVAGEAVMEFAQLIAKFEESTDMLVIDQVCNPGGELLYMYALASMLTDSPLALPTHRLTITQQDVNLALEYIEMLSKIASDEEAREQFGNSLAGYKVDYTFILGVIEHFKFIINEWQKGHLTTKACYVYGITEQRPHPTSSYSKPILMLIDSLDFSGADFMPSILQDNQRALLFGCRTAGAGGAVEQHSFPNLLGLSSYSFTTTLAERPSGIPLENLGVMPDILYTPTPADLQYGYRDYASAVNYALMLLSVEE